MIVFEILYILGFWLLVANILIILNLCWAYKWDLVVSYNKMSETFGKVGRISGLLRFLFIHLLLYTIGGWLLVHMHIFIEDLGNE